MNLIDLLSGNNPTLAAIVWPLIGGVILAACAVFFCKQTVGKFVKKLFDEKAVSEASARSLSDLGLEKNRFLRLALRRDTTLRKMVLSAEDGTTERYYIPEDKAYRAEVTYNPDGSSVLTIVIAVVAFIALAVILMAVIPDLIGMMSDAIHSF